MNGAVGELLSLNGYAYVNGNPVNLVDPSGMIGELPSFWAGCTSVFAGFDTSLLFGVGAGNGVGIEQGGIQIPCIPIVNPITGEVSGCMPPPSGIGSQLGGSNNPLFSGIGNQFGGGISNSSNQPGGTQRRGPSALPPGTVLAGTQCDENDRSDWRWRVQLHGENYNPRPGQPREVQSHHGVTDEWMQYQFGQDGYNRNQAPTVLMPTANHTQTFGPLNDLMIPKGWNWGNASWGEMNNLAFTMFDAASTPQECQNEYWDRFKDYVKGLICHMAVRLAVQSLTQLPASTADMARWAGVQACDTIKW